MCRWMGWLGQPVLIDELLFKTQHGIVDQSLHSRMGAETTNGDGFGMGWYGAGEGPGVYHSVSPPWGDANLRELAAHIESPLFLTHVRAGSLAFHPTTLPSVRHCRWLFVTRLHRRFTCPARPYARRRAEQFADCWLPPTLGRLHLALTLGLESDPIAALERTSAYRSHRRREPRRRTLQGTFWCRTGVALAVRYRPRGPTAAVLC